MDCDPIELLNVQMACCFANGEIELYLFERSLFNSSLVVYILIIAKLILKSILNYNNYNLIINIIKESLAQI